MAGYPLYPPPGLIGASRRCRRDLFSLRRALRTVDGAWLDGLGVADGLSEHLAQLSLGLRRFPRASCLPMCHGWYVGMPEAQLKPKARIKADLRPHLHGSQLARLFDPRVGADNQVVRKRRCRATWRAANCRDVPGNGRWR